MPLRPPRHRPALADSITPWGRLVHILTATWVTEVGEGGGLLTRPHRIILQALRLSFGNRAFREYSNSHPRQIQPLRRLLHRFDDVALWAPTNRYLWAWDLPRHPSYEDKYLYTRVELYIEFLEGYLK